MSGAEAAGRGGLPVAARRGLLVIAAAAAVTGVLAGLARVGVALAWGPAHAIHHGPLFVLGVFGTVIGLERAVAIGRPWAASAPGLAAAAAVAMLGGLALAPWLAVAASAALVAVNVAIVARHAAAHTGLMLVGSAVLLAGAAAWAAARPVFVVVPAWIGFFVLTIVAERLELSRLAPTPRWARGALVVAAGVLAAAACVGLVTGAPAWPMLGVAMAGLGAWQLAFDLARRTLARPGLPRYAAIGVLAGAAWLVVTGAVVATRPVPPVGPIYDAALHGVLVGYVLSMVFAHAPIILPAVARVTIPYHPVLLAPLAVLHGGLVARVAGDLAGDAGLRQAGSIANAIALAAFAAAVVLRSARTAAPARGSRGGRG